jgi:sec-independent protein translocase protein TatA
VIDISPIQILIVLAIALLVFGPKRLPEMGRSVGRGLREFKAAVTGDHDDDPRPSRSPERAASSHSPSPHEDEDLEGVVVPGDAPPPGRAPEAH